MMMQYTEFAEQGYATPINTTVGIEDSTSTTTQDNKLSLTPLWEYIIRAKFLPESLDLDNFFQTVHERLHNPEWEVRQHALRVLVDFIPLIPIELLDIKIQTILGDLVTNLGHLGPAVRKGAVDSLRSYVNYTEKTDEIIRNLVENGIENAQLNKVQTNVVLGIILSLPYLINNKINDSTITYVVHRLLDKIVKVVHQETVLRSLLRIREIIGYDKFDECLVSHESYNSKKDFDLLCEVYDLHIFKSSSRVSHYDSNNKLHINQQFKVNNSNPVNQASNQFINNDYSSPRNESTYNNTNNNYIDTNYTPYDINKDVADSSTNSISIPNELKDPVNAYHVNVVTTTYFKTEDEDFNTSIELDEDTVILETEIQLKSGSAITMKIHEESLHNSLENMDQNRNQTFKVLPDYDPKDYDYLRRTPRRVRFGGEIIKLRTPDSDSNLPSDDDPILSITSDNDKPIIEIKYIENETRTTTRTSRIPIPLKQTQSAPNSPFRNNLYKSKIYKSSPNLSKFKSQPLKIDGKSRIPRRFNTEVKKTVETKIQIKIKDKPKKPKLLEKPKSTFKSKLLSPRSHSRKRSKSVETLKTNVMTVSPMPRRNSREDEFSPIPIHNEIEVLHNLTRTPSPNLVKTTSNDQLNIIKAADAFQQNPIADLNTSASNLDNPFTSFQVYNSSFSDSYYEFADSPIPTKDTGECLTCSSSGSDTVPVEKKTLTEFGVLSHKLVEDLQNMDDIRARQRGLEELLRVMQTPGVIDSLEERLPTLLYILFSAEQQPILQQIAEQSLSIIFTSMNQQALISRLHQIALNLSKTGSPLGVRLAILFMRRVSPRLLVDQLLADPILGAKSSKVREGALQILMTVSRIFPSTDINIPKSVKAVTGALKDKKRKVRQAALEALAALAQLSSPSMVVDVASEVTSNWNDQDQILKVIRTRLSRKQLPAVNMNGNIRYSTPTGESEIEWLSRGSGTHSPHLSTPVIHPTKLPEDTANNNLPTNEISQISQTQESTSFSDNQMENEVSTVSLVTKAAQLTPDTQSTRQPRFISAQQLPETINSSVEANNNHLLNQTMPDVTEFYNKGSPMMNRFVNNNFSEENQVNSASTNKSDSSGSKRNYWRSNSRHQMIESTGKFDEVESDWSRDSREEPINQAPQIWAIDPASLKTGKQVTNEPLRQVYIVNKNVSKSAATNTTSTFTTAPVYRKPPRGRSFSPPASKHSDYDSYDEQERVRFVNSNYERETRRYRRELRDRKSYSSEHLPNVEKLRTDREDSESSSGSSIRQTGNWHRDLRSGIPVPIATETKLRIRNSRPSQIPKGPLSTPYSFPRVKSPSPHSTPDKFTIPQIIGRQPFSSGSESSGYFTPPAEPLLNEPSPQQSPNSDHRNSIGSVLFGSPNPQRFIQIDSPKHFEKNFTIIDSEQETFEDEEVNVDIIEDVHEDEHHFDRKNTATSLDELSLHDTSIFAERSLSKNEAKSATNSLDETDFTQITFSENRALSKSEVDIKISRQYSRKNVNSAPALADVTTNVVDTNTVKTSLPGSVVDSLEDTEAPENLIIQSPNKKTTSQILPKSSVRRKTGRAANHSGIYPDSLKPFPKPREGSNETFTLLESSEWENMMKGLNGLVRLIRHHPDIVENQMHSVCVILGKHVRNLRSQVARAACLASFEMFGTFKRSLEVELDELAWPLLQRTADTNKFLRSDANGALDEMSANMSLPKVVATVSYRGVGHQNAVVRCAASRLLCNIVHRLEPEKFFQLPKDTRDKILLCGAKMLTEGSLETRKHAKMLLGHLAAHCQFQRAMGEAVPNQILRHIEKQLRALT